MKIPKSFKLGGHNIEVKYDFELRNKEDNRGEAHYRYDEIVLQPSTDAIPVKPAMQEHTFFHELIHFILFFLHEDKLRNDDDFVDRFALLLHQFYTTQEFDVQA